MYLCKKSDIENINLYGKATMPALEKIANFLVPDTMCPSYNPADALHFVSLHTLIHQIVYSIF